MAGTEIEEIQWTFYGYQTPAGRKDVQEWFDGLSDDERDEIRDILEYLHKLPPASWKGKEFKRLEKDISEVRIDVGVLGITIRIYGAFWPQKQRHAYTLLLGKTKKKKKDKTGKAQAEKRLGQLLKLEATIHEFEYQRKSAAKAPAQQQGATKTR